EDFNQNEKFHHFSEKFPVNPKKIENIKTGDIVFYETNFFVIFYEDFKTQYVYTPIGTINNISGLKEVLKKSKVTVELK
ncbi:MAG: cyclophilin-like fold protein, partial [Cetobacterium sp.]